MTPDETLTGHPLLQPLAPAQQALVDAMFTRVQTHGADWPVFDFVRRVLRAKQIDAQTALLNFPVAINRRNPRMTYRHFWSDGGGAWGNDQTRLRLTVAGVSEASNGGRGFANFIAYVIRELARIEADIEPQPDTVATTTVEPRMSCGR